MWGKILDSSIWIKEAKETRLVWITLLAMRDSQGIVQASVIGLADRAKVSVDECRIALNVFLSPDEDDTSKVENGIRIREVPGGWQIVNHDLYRFSTEAKREVWRQDKAEQREREKEYEKSKEAEYKKRKKVINHLGVKAGAKKAIAEGFKQYRDNGGNCAGT